MGAVAHRKGVRPSGGGTTTPAPLVLDNTDISTDANASAGSSTSSSTAGCPASSADSSSILGGSSTDISGNSAISDPSALFGGLGGSGGLSSLGSLTGGGGLPGGLDASALTSLFSGGRKRRQTNEYAEFILHFPSIGSKINFF